MRGPCCSRRASVTLKTGLEDRRCSDGGWKQVKPITKCCQPGALFGDKQPIITAFVGAKSESTDLEKKSYFYFKKPLYDDCINVFIFLNLK